MCSLGCVGYLGLAGIGMRFLEWVSVCLYWSLESCIYAHRVGLLFGAGWSGWDSEIGSCVGLFEVRCLDHVYGMFNFSSAAAVGMQYYLILVL